MSIHPDSRTNPADPPHDPPHNRPPDPPEPVPLGALASAANSPPTLGDLIRERRARLRITLDALAEAVSCAKSYLWMIENGRRENPADDILQRIESALGFPDGRLIQAARWQSTPDAVRREVRHLQSRQAPALRLAQILGRGIEPDGPRLLLKGSLDEAYRSGELHRLIHQLTGDAAPPDLAPVRFLPRQVPVINKVAAGYPTEFTDLGYPARIADEYVSVPDLDDPDAFAARVVGDSMIPDYRQGDVVVFSPARPIASGMDCFARLEPLHETTFKRIYFETSPLGESLIRLQPLNSAYPPRTLPRDHIAGLYAAVTVLRTI